MLEEWTVAILQALWATMRDVTPILALLVFFQVIVLRRPIPNLGRVVLGGVYVVLGLTLFLVGLDEALFPLGRIMAKQLSNPAFVYGTDATYLGWWQYYWVFLFAAAIGFSTTVAEPALIAVSMKANEASGGELSVWGLRIAVAIGVGLSVALGAFRIVTGTPLWIYMIVGYLVVIVQTSMAPRSIIALAYDSGGVTTSTVTVPLVTALGLGLASTVPGRSALIDGFGLIALASLFPMITVMGFAQLSEWRTSRQQSSALAAADLEQPPERPEP